MGDEQLKALHDGVAGEEHVAVVAAVVLKHHVERDEHDVIEKNNEERAHADARHTADDF